MADDVRGPEAPARSFLSRRAANWIRFSIKNVFVLAAFFLFSLGSPWLFVVPVMSFMLLVVAEELFADIDATEDMPPPWYLNLMMWLSLPLLLLLTVGMLNVVGPGIPVVDAFLRAIGIDPDVSRASIKVTSIVGLVFSVGSLYGLAGLNVAHELIHRTGSWFDMVVGRMLLAFTFDTGYSIDHVYGHHRTVGTEADPSTARRGEYSLAFVVRATIGQNVSAFTIERDRLKRKNIPDLPWNNRFWRGHAISLAYVVAAFLLGGWRGGLVFIACALMGKTYHTLITYIEHYGLVRIPGQRVQPRHAWNSNRRMSLGILYNAPLHAEHHMFATRHFWELHKVEGNAPLLPYGSVVMFLIALSPSAWRRVITPRLLEWDTRFASEEEREYLRSKNQLSAGA